MASDTAEGFINRSTVGEARIDNIATAMQQNAPGYWESIAGSTIGRLGERNTGDFRPSYFAQEWGVPGNKKGFSAESKDLFTMTRGGNGPFQSRPDLQGTLNDAALLGSVYDIAPGANGLSRAVGGLATVGAVAGGVGSTLSWPLALPAAFAPAFALESGPVVRAIAGRSTPVADALYARMPGMLPGVVYSMPPEAQQ